MAKYNRTGYGCENGGTCSWGCNDEPEPTLTIRIPRAWLERYTLPIDFGRVQRPERITIEDDHTEADCFVLVGWIVFSERGPVREYLVGTVVRQRIDGHVEDVRSHEHVYIKNLPGRRVINCEPHEGPYNVEVGPPFRDPVHDTEVPF